MLSYLPIVAPVIAILNGVIAVYVAQFKPEQARAKLALLGVAIILGASAAGATIWSQHYVVQQQEADKNERAATRRNLAAFINSSAIILKDLTSASANQQEARVQADA
jgi:uncharacterized membrane-anchored protein